MRETKWCTVLERVRKSFFRNHTTRFQRFLYNDYFSKCYCGDFSVISYTHTHTQVLNKFQIFYPERALFITSNMYLKEHEYTYAWLLKGQEMEHLHFWKFLLEILIYILWNFLGRQRCIMLVCTPVDEMLTLFVASEILVLRLSALKSTLMLRTL